MCPDIRDPPLNPKLGDQLTEVGGGTPLPLETRPSGHFSKGPEKTCQRSPQGQKAQKKKAEGPGGTVRSPDQKRGPSGHLPSNSLYRPTKMWGTNTAATQMGMGGSLGFQVGVDPPELPPASPAWAPASREFAFR